jgi:Asp-tRNA(Asn)/Glu-tRNA(Gln) amidotransferase A subunit family amidase
VPIRGIVPLAPTLDHAGPMARSLEDCVPLLAALAGVSPPLERAPLRRIAVSPRLGLVELDADVGDGFDAALAACRGLGAELVDVPAPDVELEPGSSFLDVVCAEMLVYHRRFDDRRDLYRPSILGFLEYAERGALTAEDYIAAQARRTETTATWLDWFAQHRIDALLEPTVPIVARPRGHGYDEAFTDVAEISYTHYWNWTGFPVAALPSGVGGRSGLPVGVSLIGATGSDWDVLAAGVELQSRLGMWSPIELASERKESS